jgi:hypothetical protein
VAPIDPDSTGTAIEKIRKAPKLEPGPGVLEWKAPASPGSVKEAFDALGMGSIVDSDREGVRFEAWKTPRAAALAVTAIAAAALLGLLLLIGVGDVAIVLLVLTAAFAGPFFLMPEYRVTGRIAGTSLLVRIAVKGLLARRESFEAELKTALERG